MHGVTPFLLSCEKLVLQHKTKTGSYYGITEDSILRRVIHPGMAFQVLGVDFLKHIRRPQY